MTREAAARARAVQAAVDLRLVRGGVDKAPFAAATFDRIGESGPWNLWAAGAAFIAVQSRRADRAAEGG